MLVVEDNLKDSLQEIFGFDSFKGQQEEVIKSVLAKKDTFVIMPTGGGKSLCYQLPAIISEGTAIIVSPLIALMKNQVDQIRSYSKEDSIAHFLNSSLNKTQVKKVKEDLLDKHTKLLYVAPETLTKESNIEFFKEINISFVAVDEAHCISEWGHDFRPEYRSIRNMISQIANDIPIMALTATATPKVRSDIIKNLNLHDPDIFMSSFNRPNLYYEVIAKANETAVEKSIIKFIKTKPGKSGIVYCLSRKSAEKLAKKLVVNDIKAAAYHAGLDSATRTRTQDEFLMEQSDVIVATIAFGMGIDKPDVRFVIHYNIPKSIENYYQETGRAGRDGLEGICLAYYSYKDVLKLEKFMRDKSVAEREMSSQLLNEIVAYAETSVCRRKFLLDYFGEDYPDRDCGNCDNCRNPKEKIEAGKHVSMALKAISSVKENHGIQHIVNLLTGTSTQEINTYRHNENKFFGKGEEKGKNFWNSILRQALLQKLIIKGIENYGLLRISNEGREFMKKPTSFEITLNHDYESVLVQEVEMDAKSAVVDPTMFEMLKDLRRKVATKLDIPPFVVFQDPSLEDMAIQYPVTIEELNNITGVSKGKASRYGKEFVALIKKYVEENEIEVPDDFIVKSVINKSGLKYYIIQNVDRQMLLEDIARSKDLALEDLYTSLESIVASGVKLNLDYYINNNIDEEHQDIIYDYFKTATTDSLDVAYEELKEDGVDMSELQLIRIKFMSEMAN